jgi:predicted nucleic acid-binding protein
VIAYLDTSALLRLVLREPGALDELNGDGVAGGSGLVLLQRPILTRASEPFPTALGTLDALHLATALVRRDRSHQALTVATHDRDLTLASRSFGLEVLGT